MKAKWFLLVVAVASIATCLITGRFFDSVAQRSQGNVITYIVYVVGGAILSIVPFDRDRQRSGWARGLFTLSAAVLVFIGATELIRHYAVWVPSPAVAHGLEPTLWVLRGVVLGFLLALILSGELEGKKISSRANA